MVHFERGNVSASCFERGSGRAFAQVRIAIVHRSTRTRPTWASAEPGQVPGKRSARWVDGGVEARRWGQNAGRLLYAAAIILGRGRANSIPSLEVCYAFGKINGTCYGGRMRGQPKKGVVSLGVNSLARETGLAKQTVSERMRRGQTADQIRIYAATREGRPPQNGFSYPEAPPKPSKSAEAQGAYELIVRGRERIDAIEDAKLRRAQGAGRAPRSLRICSDAAN